MNSKNKIHVVIDALGGWKRAFALIKPSTSTTVMILTLVTLVIFFPENQWGWEDGEPTSPPARTTSTTTPSTADTDPEPVQTQAPTQTSTQPETVETPAETENTNTWQTPTYDGSDSTQYTEQTSTPQQQQPQETTTPTQQVETATPTQQPQQPTGEQNTPLNPAWPLPAPSGEEAPST